MTRPVPGSFQNHHVPLPFRPFSPSPLNYISNPPPKMVPFQVELELGRPVYHRAPLLPSPFHHGELTDGTGTRRRGPKLLVQHSVPLHRFQGTDREPWDARHRRVTDPPPFLARRPQRRKQRFCLLPQRDPIQGLPAQPTSFHLDAFESQVNVSVGFGGLIGIVLQGSGPHFCPGGNVNYEVRAGEDAFSLAPLTGFVAELRLREAGFVVCALHGLVQGGGLAMSQVVDLRFADAETTYTLGNLSRGAVPCILLSSALPKVFATLANAMAFYLEDAIFDMAAALSLDLIHGVLPSVASTKEAAFHAAFEMLPSAA